MDDSFFEKFGSILRQVSQKAALEESTPLAPLKEIEEQDGEKSEGDCQCSSPARDSDSGNETLLDTDSEPDDTDKLDLYVEAVGWNVSKHFYYRQNVFAEYHNLYKKLNIGPITPLIYPKV